ncbi:MAG: AAA family ATPase [Herpetosiphonaceae bacterium]|nr:AAA family ATPase [Herpetosiphonaceae bacterium]
MELLERGSYLHDLRTAMSEVISGMGRIALVNGEAGIGKTVLVDQFVHQQPDAVRVLWGSCDALFTPRPLGPLYDMASHMQEHVPALLAVDANRTAIFTTFLNELQGRPVIAVFEDVHWADEATLDLLRFLGRQIMRTNALLTLTYRDDELGQRHPLRLVLGDLVALPATRRIALRALSERAVRTLVGQRAVDAAALYRQTGGNPFFVTEVLAGSGGLPATIRDAVLARAARLSPSGQAVLRAAAVIGPRIEPWVLAQVTGAEALSAEECLAIGMLVPHGELLAFRHELARQTVLESISPPHKIALHRMTLDAIKHSPTASNDLACLAHHAEAAYDRDAVLEYALAAARQAAAAGAHREAAALYALTLRFAAELLPADHAHLLEAYAQQCCLIDQRSTAVQILREALQLRRKAGSPIREGGVLAHMATMLMGLGQDVEAEQCAGAAIAVLEAQPPSAGLALAYRVRAEIDGINHNLNAAIHWAEKSIAFGEHAANKAEYFIVQNILGSAWMSLDYERGCRYLEQSCTAADARGQKEAVVHAYAQLGSIASELHHFRQAEQYLSDGLAYAAEHDLDRLRFYILAWQAWTHLHLGVWIEAAEEAGMVPHDANMSVVSRLMALLTVGRLCVRQGDPRATGLLDEALSLTKHMHNIDRLGPLYTTRAEAAWQRGDCQQVVAEAGAAYDLAVRAHHAWYVGELAFWRWRAGDDVQLPEWVAKAFALHIAGNWRAAADEWARLGCPYERARALADGDVVAQLAALDIFEWLGAQPVADDLRCRMRAKGVLRIPRGPRTSTRDNPFGLTTRQLDILGLLTTGLSNAQIAAQLYISPKTVDHHVSAVLARLDVHSREEAAVLARQHALLT